MRDLTRRLVGYALPMAAFALLLVPNAMALTDGEVSSTLAKNMYCSVHNLIEGNIGVLLGMALVFMGLWSMAWGAKIMVAAPMIVAGSLVTALPNFAEACFTGISNLLVAEGIAIAPYTPLACPTTAVIITTPRMSSHDVGSYGPSSVAGPVDVIKNAVGSPDDRDGQ